MSTILRIDEVTKSYEAHVALDGVSLSLKTGTIFGLLGPNGAGKTSLIRIITQIMAPDAGKVYFKGAPMQLSHMQSIGYLPEERGLYRKMKVRELAIYLSMLKGLESDKAKQRVDHWFERLGVAEWSNRKVETLSKGMQQKVQFAITVAHDPELLILDEPFSGFDPVNTELLKTEIEALKSAGKTIIFSTHNMASVEEVCDEAALINKGKVVIDGTVESIRKRHSKALYQISFRGSKVAFANALGSAAEIVALKELNPVSDALLKTHGSISSSQLLQALIKHVEIVSFAEKIPSMHDVFLELVSPKEETVE